MWSKGGYLRKMEVGIYVEAMGTRYGRCLVDDGYVGMDGYTWEKAGM